MGINQGWLGLLWYAVTGEGSKVELFEALAMPLFDSLYNFAHWLTRNREDAEDLVQETYVKALKGFPSFQPGTNFRAWIYRIMRNTFLTSRAGLARYKTVSLDDEEEELQIPAATLSPEGALLERTKHDRVQSAIEQLPVVYQEVLLLCDAEGMSYQEIAETVGIPIGTVMSRLARARKTVREALGNQMQGA